MSRTVPEAIDLFDELHSDYLDHMRRAAGVRGQIEALAVAVGVNDEFWEHVLVVRGLPLAVQLYSASFGVPLPDALKYIKSINPEDV